MSGAYFPDVLNEAPLYRLDRRLQSDEGEGIDGHQLIGDMSLNPEKLYEDKETYELEIIRERKYNEYD